jgi:hypothetical protein
MSEIKEAVALAVVGTTANTSQAEESHLDGLKKEYKRSENLEIVLVKKGENRIRLINPALREYLYYNTETEVVQAAHLEQPSDSDGHKRVRAMHATFPLGAFAAHLSTLKSLTESDIEHTEGLTFDVVQDFVTIVEDHFNTTSADALHALDKGVFTFEQLTVALGATKGLVSFLDDGKMIAGKIKSAQVKSSMFAGVYLEIVLAMYIHTGRQFVATQHSLNIGMFKGEKTSSEMGVYVLANHPEVASKLLARGQRYEALTSKPSYLHTTGNITRRSWYGPRHFKAKGRIMVDCTSMRRVDPNYGFYFGVDRYRDNTDTPENKVHTLTDEMRVAMPPFVYGFSFAAKVWGEMDLDHITDIDFRTDAYEKLVLEPQTKRVIFSLVDTDYRENSDIISGKGGGCIFLLAGPPGVGKTLTAEAISERLHRPLYMVSVGELGTNVDTLEESLRQILETAATWNAVLLIDEADIFLEQRTPDDIERNAMVGVFLRLLEYYEGILFLTTNRASNIDQAFFSRISVAIHYENLKPSDRRQIWKNLLQNSKIDPSLADRLYQHELNGRQIKNAIRNANALAKAENRVVGIQDFDTVIGTAVKFDGHMAAQRLENAPKIVKKPNLFQRIKLFLFGD